MTHLPDLLFCLYWLAGVSTLIAFVFHMEPRSRWANTVRWEDE